VRNFVRWLRGVQGDPRIPRRNWIALGFLALWILSPIDLLADWIPFLGQLDDIVAALLALGYIFDSPDSKVYLDHWPWAPHRFQAIAKLVRSLTRFVPGPIRRVLFRFPKPTVDLPA
jgi:uncharacterized membrane protein YkvA (DUF1232 family)